MASDPPFLLESVETATQTGRWYPQVGGNIERPGTATESLERCEHVEPAEWNVPVGPQLFVESALDLSDERLQPSPC
jgi:hypothetical protein